MHAGKAETRLVVGILMMFVLLCAHATLAMQLPPHWFRGNVTINGETAPDGTVVSAEIGGRVYANTTTISGKYGADGNFYVPSDDLDTAEKEGGVDGDVVNFYVNNELAANATFSNGGNTRLDLKIGKEPALEPKPEIEKPAKVQEVLVPLAIAIIIIVLLGTVIVVLIKRRKK